MTPNYQQNHGIDIRPKLSQPEKTDERGRWFGKRRCWTITDTNAQKKRGGRWKGRLTSGYKHLQNIVETEIWVSGGLIAFAQERKWNWVRIFYPIFPNAKDCKPWRTHL